MTAEMNNNRLYLVTGAAGFLGGTVCRTLIAQGKKVRAFILPNDPARKFIPEEAEIVEGDLTSLESLRPFFDIPEGWEGVVLHIASIVTSSPDFNQKIIDVNVGGTRNIIELCLTMPRIKKLVYCSSTGAIPELPDGQVMKEIDYFDETKVVGCYSLSKAWGTQEVLDAVHHRGLNACVVHPSGIMGPGISAVDKGRCGECYILANDVIPFKDFCKLVTQESGGKKVKFFIPPAVANIAGHVMEAIAKKKGEKPVLTTFNVYNLTRNNRFDCTKAREELGYTTRSYEETIHDMVEWLIAEGFIQKEA